MEFRTLSFTGPSGFTYEIREQNGADEDILSNAHDAKTLMNLTKFISSIVVKTDFTTSGRLTIEDSLRLPINDRYHILFTSRIFSLGEEVEYAYDWGKDNGGKVNYGQDLNEFLFEDYSKTPTEEEMEAKPLAIPYYPEGKKLTDFSITLASGKSLMFDLINGYGEQTLITMPREKQTRNSPILCRNLRLLVDDKYEVVSNFSLFTSKDMAEIRKLIIEVDPVFEGESIATNPITDEELRYPILMSPNFFYLTEA